MVGRVELVLGQGSDVVLAGDDFGRTETCLWPFTDPLGK